MVTIIAFITMFIDHVWFIFFPGDDIWRIIWRIAFPLFAWGIVRWYKFTKNRFNYIKRIFFLAVISQIPLIFIFWNDYYNVCFTLLFWLVSLEIIETQKIKKYLKFIIIWILLFIANYFHFDYWAYGVLVIILLHLFWQKKISILYFTLLTFLFYCVNYETFKIHFHIELYAIFSIFLLYFTPIQKYDFKLNFYFKYWFYPIHLAVLYLIKVFFY